MMMYQHGIGYSKYGFTRALPYEGFIGVMQTASEIFINKQLKEDTLAVIFDKLVEPGNKVFKNLLVTPKQYLAPEPSVVKEEDEFMSEEEAVAMLEKMGIKPIGEEPSQPSTSVKVISENYGVVTVETNPNETTTKQFVNLIQPQIQKQAYQENVTGNKMFMYGVRWTRKNKAIKPLNNKSYANKGLPITDAKATDGYVYDTVDQNGNSLALVSDLQPIINEIEKTLGRDMSDYDAVIGNIYLPGQRIQTHRDTTESLSARNYPVIVYTIGAGNAINVYENVKNPGTASFASDKKTTIPTKNGTIYTFGMDGKGRFELGHDSPHAIKKGDTQIPITMPDGTVIKDYTITLTFRRAADLEPGMPTTPAKITTGQPTQSSTSVNPLVKAGVKSTDMYGNAAKDIQMADESTQFIGFGTIMKEGNISSTDKYAKAWGNKANTGIYTAGDIIMVSGSGNFGRGGVDKTEEANAIKKTLTENYKPLLDKAIAAGASFRIGNQYSKGNLSDQLVADYLQKKGYTEEKLNGYSRWTSLIKATQSSTSVNSNDIYSQSENKNVVISNIKTKDGKYDRDANIKEAKANNRVYTMEVVSDINSFSNPWASFNRTGTIKTNTTKEAVINYIDWLTTDKFKDVKPKRKAFILDVLKSGKLKGRQLQYYAELGEPSHATALDYLINKYDWSQPSTSVNERKTYSGKVTSLKPNQIFVFGSNPEGRHGAGAAKYAKDNFGAMYGQGEGLQGQSYALPTKDLRVKENNSLRSISPEQITSNIKKLYDLANRSNKEFLVSDYSGTNLNGYTGQEMADMFISAGPIPNNIVFHENFDKLISTQPPTDNLNAPDGLPGIPRTSTDCQ